MKNNSTFLLLFLLFFTLAATAQNLQKGNWQWSKQFGAYSGDDSNMPEEVYDFKIDNEGFIYSIGMSYNYLNYDSLGQQVEVTIDGQGNQLTPGAYLAKHDCNGKLIYMITMNKVTNLGGIALDDSSNIYLLGRGFGGSGIKTPYGWEYVSLNRIFLLKFNKYGKLKNFTNVHTSASLRFNNCPVLFYDSGFLKFIVINNAISTIAGGDTLKNKGFYLVRCDKEFNTIKSFESFKIKDFPPLFYADLNGNKELYSIATTDDTITILDSKLLYKKNIQYGNCASILMNSEEKKIYFYKESDSTNKITTIPKSSFLNDSTICLLIHGLNNSVFDGTKVFSNVYVADEGNFVLVKYDTSGKKISSKSGINQSYWYINSYALERNFPPNQNKVNLNVTFGGKYLIDSILIDTKNRIYPVIFNFDFEDTSKNATKVLQIEGESIGGIAHLNSIQTTTKGDLYVGGQLSGYIVFGTDTLRTYSGTGRSDGFIAKWGLACSDSSALLPPLPPDSLVANAQQNTIKVQWKDFAQYEDKFYLYRATDSAGPYARIDSTLRNITTYYDVSALPNKVYWYKVTAANSEGESRATNIDSAIIIPTTINNPPSNIALWEVFPNPVVNATMVSIAAKESAEANFQLLDLNGQLIEQKAMRIQSGTQYYRLDCSHLPAGSYWLQLHSGNYRQTKQLVVVR
jgi:hypothetical protein